MEGGCVQGGGRGGEGARGGGAGGVSARKRVVGSALALPLLAGAAAAVVPLFARSALSSTLRVAARAIARARPPAEASRRVRSGARMRVLGRRRRRRASFSKRLGRQPSAPLAGASLGSARGAPRCGRRGPASDPTDTHGSSTHPDVGSGVLARVLRRRIDRVCRRGPSKGSQGWSESLVFLRGVRRKALSLSLSGGWGVSRVGKVTLSLSVARGGLCASRASGGGARFGPRPAAGGGTKPSAAPPRSLRVLRAPRSNRRASPPRPLALCCAVLRLLLLVLHFFFKGGAGGERCWCWCGCPMLMPRNCGGGCLKLRTIGGSQKRGGRRGGGGVAGRGGGIMEKEGGKKRDVRPRGQEKKGKNAATKGNTLTRRTCGG